MIWLLTNIWWLVPVPVAIGLLALANLPMTLSVIRRVPVRVRLALACVALFGLSFQAGRWVERRAQEAAQATAEARADRKAATVAKAATDRAGKATAKIRARTEDAADEVREIVRNVPRACPDVVLPPRVSDLGRAAVERAREAL